MTRVHKPRAILDVECAICGHIHSATSEEVISGTWRDCPKCGAPPDAEEESECPTLTDGSSNGAVPSADDT